MIKLGQRLKEERIAKNLTIDEIAKATKIQPQFITAIEQSNYKKLPSKAYAQGFVKNYISFLGLPLRDSLAMFRREFDEREYIDLLPESFTKKKDIPLHKINWQRTVLSGSVIILILVGYFLFQYRAAFFAPSLTVAIPKENSRIHTDMITVKGATDSNSTVMVNTILTYVDGTGHFTKIVPVFSGKSTIVIVSTNKFGKKTIVERHVVVK